MSHSKREFTLVVDERELATILASGDKEQADKIIERLRIRVIRRITWSLKKNPERVELKSALM